jgi:hypothetical protein
VVEAVASYPHLPQVWWDDEGFQLAAAGFGIHQRPAERKLTAEETGRHVEPWARQILEIDADAIDLHSSWFQSAEIAVRGYAPVNPICAQAHQRFQEARKIEAEKDAAAKERARKRRMGAP